MKPFGLALLAAAIVGGALVQNRQKGGPPGVFLTDYPKVGLTAIAGAPTKTSIVLSLASEDKATLDIKFRPEGAKQSQQMMVDVMPKTAQEFEIKNLKPGTRYTYEIKKMNSEDRVEGSFVTARAPGSAFVFDIQADSHLDGNSSTQVYENTLKNMLADKPDFLVDLGDTFMVDKYQNYQDSAKQYDAQRYWFSIPGSQMSIFLCLGNHDGETAWPQRGGDVSSWAQQQRESRFPMIKSNGFYSGAPKKGLYYDYAWGDARFIVLDPFVATKPKPRTDEDGWNWTLGKEQFTWFENVLKTSKEKYKFVFIHHLVGGFGSEARGGIEAADKWEWGNEKEFPTKRSGWAEPIHSLMKKYGVTAMFHGHDHLYVRQEKDGILYIETPQPSQARGDNTNSAANYGYKEGKILGSSGHLRVSVDPKQVKIEYVKSRLTGANREVVDSVVKTAK